MTRTSSRRELKRKAIRPLDEQVELNDDDNDRTTTHNGHEDDEHNDDHRSIAMETNSVVQDFTSDYKLKVVGGHRLTHVRPQFTENERLMVPNENRILFFSTKNKAITHTITPAEEGDELTSLCLHPFLAYFQMFAFSQSGQVYQCNYQDGSTTARVELKLHPKSESIDQDEDITSKQHRKLVWGTCLNYRQERRENYLVLFYAVQVTINDHVNKPNVHYEIYSCPFAQPECAELLFKSNNFNEQRITFGPQGRYLVYIERSRCYFLALEQGGRSEMAKDAVLLFKRKNKTHFKHFNSVVCSPTENLLAHSEEDGRIFLHPIDPDEPTAKLPKTQLHWHPMAICDMCFSSNGTYLYSVGSEGVVVRWTVKTLERNFCARVGYGIRFVVANGSDIAITLQNNIIRLITSHFSDLEGEVSTLMYYEHQQFTSGLVYNSKLDAIALNGRPGFIQFFNPLRPGQLQTLDVTQTNYIEPLNGVEKIYNIDVHQVACSPDGNWLATFELRDDQQTLPEMRLKFWRYNSKLYKEQPHLAKYEMHTCIHLPHKDRLVDMRFSPNSKLLLTTSLDRNFKLWAAQTNDHWACVQTGSFNPSLLPGSVDFASDSSVLAIAYDSIVTLWNSRKPDQVTLIDSIVDSKEDFQVLGVHFGSKLCAHLLAFVTDKYVTVWELVRMRSAWTWRLEIDSESKENAVSGIRILKHTFDSASNRITLLTSDQQLIVLSLASTQPKPEGKMKLPAKLSSSDIESMLLFPHSCAGNSSNNLFGASLVCLLSKSKQMYALESQKLEGCPHLRNPGLEDVAGEVGEVEKQAAFNFVDTLNRRKQADKSDDNQAKSDLTRHNFSQFNSTKLIDEMFYNVPSHVLPPIEVIAKTFLNSLQIGGIPLEGERKLTENETPIVYDKNEIDSDTRQVLSTSSSSDRMESNSNLQSDEQPSQHEDKLTQLLDQNHFKKFTFDEDYSFLRS